MTDTPRDLPTVEKGEDGSLTYMSQELRAARWTVAKTRAHEKGTDPRTEFNEMLLENRKATLGPNPTQGKARKLYEYWLSGCGGVDKELTQMRADWCPYDQLNSYDQQRWMVLAKALGGMWIDGKLCHDLTAEMVARYRRDEEKYKSIPAGFGMFEYDNVLNPEEAGYSDKVDREVNGVFIHNDDPTYDEWVDQQPKARQHWWQFWRPAEVFTHYKHYRRWIGDRETRRHCASSGNLTKSSAR